MSKVTKLKTKKRPAQQVVVRMPQQFSVQQQPVSEMAQVLAMIAQAARDPKCEIAKMERLQAMRVAMIAARTEAAYDRAVSHVEGAVVNVVTDANNTHTRSRYATLPKLTAVLKPIYTGQLLSVQFSEGPPPAPAMVHVIGFLKYSDGEGNSWGKQFDRYVPWSEKGAKGGDVSTPTHASQGAITYGQRAVLKGMFQIAEADEDDDGNLAGTPEFITPEQAVVLEQLIVASGRTVEHFCNNQHIAVLAELPAARVGPAMRMVRDAIKTLEKEKAR